MNESGAGKIRGSKHDFVYTPKSQGGELAWGRGLVWLQAFLEVLEGLVTCIAGESELGMLLINEAVKG